MGNDAMRRLLIFAALLLPLSLHSQEMSVGTNLATCAYFGTMNLEAGYGLAQHWTATAGVRYNPFSYGGPEVSDIRQAKQRTVSMGTRYWPWHIFSGWWLAGKVQYQEYNVGGIRSRMTTEGDRYGAGAAFGYTYMLGAHFNVEAGLGMWAGLDNYVTYECPECGRRIEGGRKVFFLPNDIILTLSYVF